MASEVKIAAGVVLLAGSVIGVQRMLPLAEVELEPMAEVALPVVDPELSPLAPDTPLLAAVQDPAGVKPDRIAEHAAVQGPEDPVVLDVGDPRQMAVVQDLIRAEVHPFLEQPVDPDSCITCHAAALTDLLLTIDSRLVDGSIVEAQIADGPHTEFHANGTAAAQGTIRNGTRSGSWTEWYEDGSPRARGDYFDGDRHGWWTYQHTNGGKQAEGEYLYGRREGLWNEYHEDGSRKRVASFRKGGLTGVERTWHAGGKMLASEMGHYANFAEGFARTWYADGQADSRGHYLRGLRVGIWEYWLPDGAPDEARILEAGK